MKTIAIIFFLSFFIQISYAQKTIIDDCQNLKPGIYKTFDEFRCNAPSIALEYEVEKINDLACRLNIQKEKTEFIGPVWGFCDGKTAYINVDQNMSGRKVFRPGSLFMKIQYIGRYCYYLFSSVAYTNIYATGQYLPYAIDFNTGLEMCLNCDINFWFIKQSWFKKIMTRDYELWNEYKKDKTGGDLFLKYIRLYSEKHNYEVL